MTLCTDTAEQKVPRYRKTQWLAVRLIQTTQRGVSVPPARTIAEQNNVPGAAVAFFLIQAVESEAVLSGV